MRALSASDLLSVWERAAHDGPMQQALSLLSVACPEREMGALAALSIGQRDALLLRLREATFGPILTAVADCPACGERIEVALNATELDMHCSASTLASVSTAEAAVEVGDYTLQLRPPNSHDVIEASGLEMSRARAAILRRCILSAERGGTHVEPDDVPAAVLEIADERLAERDPHADVRLRLVCPACKHDTTMIFDIASFLWHEIDAWACRILREVHTLASAYGWTEEAILGLTPFRRQCYLELVGP
jgi:hypothetical protein